MAIPTADAQLEFLRKLQRLFTEGDFTATYKFALLMALADLAVREGTDTVASLRLPLSDIAEAFARYYWPQTVPYVSGVPEAKPGVLVQNLGAQAAVVNLLQELRNAGAATLPAARRLPRWPATLARLTRNVLQLPVTHLQHVGGEQDAFLYDPPRGVREPLVLKPGVAFHLRRFHGFVHELARAAWVNHVRGNRRNHAIIGPAQDLEHFLFGTPRQALQEVAAVLRPLQSGCCFYCGDRLREAAEVDHFVPWSRYPQDLARNFVLAHRGCNNAKRDFSAGERHLEHWVRRNDMEGDVLAAALGPLGMVADGGSAVEVTRWAYRQGIDMGAHGWIARGQVERLGDRCLALLE